MEMDYCLRELSANVKMIEYFLANINDDQAHWKPTAEDWSLCEVVNHLLDEERFDFPARIRHLHAGHADEWVPIHPGRWVTERKYNDQDFHQSLQAFLSERQRNLAWVNSLGQFDWSVQYHHEPLGGLSAGDLLVSWAAHDLLHIRQLNEIKYAYALKLAQPYSPGYAGDW